MLDDTKGVYWIYRNKSHVVLVGKKLWILKPDGTIVACRKDVSNVYKVAFLSGDRILTGGGKGATYRLISLVDGKELWSIPHIKWTCSSDRFAISPDERFAFDFYWWNDKDYLVKIDIQKGCMESYVLKKGLRCTKDIICDDDGALYLLQVHYDETEEGRISQNGIRCEYVNDQANKGAYDWKYRWQHEGPTISETFLDSPDLILTEDLYVYSPKTKEKFFLLENDPDWTKPGLGMPTCWFDESKQYLSIMYDNVNVVVDWYERRMVARYAGKTRKGCIINDEYWISSEEGIRRVPFPLIEDIPPRKLTTW